MSCGKSISLSTSKRRQWSWLKILEEHLVHLKKGRLTVYLPDGEVAIFGKTKRSDLQASVVLKSYKPLRKLLLSGEMAFARSYHDGEWESPNLTALFDLVLANEQLFGRAIPGSRLADFLERWRHRRNANSKLGSKRNIAYHYDLGNAFYCQWLDPSMTYSSGLFETGRETLERAQAKKYQTIAEWADLQPTDKVLEIGCGWGGFSEYAARAVGCRVHGITLSQEQLDFAHRRYRDSQIEPLASASLTDYRDTDGNFDKIVSIEMFEAVGEENWDTYFATIRNRLKPGGIAVLQVITIADDRFETYRSGCDYIQRYIFPGGFLPSPTALGAAVARQGLQLEKSRFFGDSYAKTCAQWQRAFQHQWPEIERLGFDNRFKKMWEYYLSYCEAGFKAGTIDVGFFKITKPA